LLPDVESAANDRGFREASYGTVDFGSPQAAGREPEVRYQWRATMLFLVVCCLEISDLLFAVDSVSAIVAQVNDLFLAYTSVIFAMLGLRATFFIIDVLVKLFSLLKYGVAAVLVFIGLKLIISKIYVVPSGLVCCVLFVTLSMSMIAEAAPLSHQPGGEVATLEQLHGRHPRWGCGPGPGVLAAGGLAGLRSDSTTPVIAGRRPRASRDRGMEMAR